MPDVKAYAVGDATALNGLAESTDLMTLLPVGEYNLTLDATATVTIPALTAGSIDQSSLTIGDTATVSGSNAPATGIAFQWRQSADNSTGWTNIAGATSASLDTSSGVTDDYYVQRGVEITGVQSMVYTSGVQVAAAATKTYTAVITDDGTGVLDAQLTNEPEWVQIWANNLRYNGSGQIYANTTGFSVTGADDTFTADQYIQFVINGWGPSAGSWRPMVRCLDKDNNIRVEISATGAELIEENADSQTSLDTVTETWSSGSTHRLEAVGTTAEYYVDDVLKMSATIPNITAATDPPAIATNDNDTAATIDDVEAGNIT